MTVVSDLAFLILTYCCNPTTSVNLYSGTHAIWALLATELEWKHIR